jgi:hypothetical protein
VVENRIPLDRGDNAGRQADEHGKQHGADRKLDGRRKQRGKLIDDQFAGDD